MHHRTWGIALGLTWALAGTAVLAAPAGAQQSALPSFSQAAADQYGAPSSGAPTIPNASAASAESAATDLAAGAATAPSTGTPTLSPSAVTPTRTSSASPTRGASDPNDDVAADDDAGATTPSGSPQADDATGTTAAPSATGTSGSGTASPGERSVVCPADPVRLPRQLADAVTTRTQRSRGCTLHLFQFGERMPAAVATSVQQALSLAGLRLVFRTPATEDRLSAFLASDAARALGSDPGAIGRALAARLVDGRQGSDPVVSALFGDVDVARLEHVVVTQAPGLSADEAAFARGFARGVWDAGIPVGYVEASDATSSAVKAYEGVDVPTVDGVDTRGGARDLAAILVEEVQADFGAKDSATAPLNAPGRLLRVDRSAASLGRATETSGLGGSSPLLVLACLGLAAACWSGLGLRHARRSRAR